MDDTVYERTGERRDNCCTPPCYDTDIKAAFEAVEWVRKERGWQVSIVSLEKTWIVRIHRQGYESGAICKVGNASLPAAICAAILKATETP